MRSSAPGSPTRQLLLFSLGHHTYALPLAATDRVLRSVAVTPLPTAPAVVLGVINLAGDIVPVISLRRRFGLPDRPLQLSDQLILAQTPRRKVALLVDGVQEYFEAEGSTIIDPESVLPGIGHLEGVVKTADGMFLIHDLETCLSLEEERILDRAMEEV